MQTNEELIEKYKNDMLNMLKRSYFPYEENSPSQSVQANAVLHENAYDSGDADGELSNQNANENENLLERDKLESTFENTEQAYGALKVRAYSGNIAYPIETAFVRVFDSDDRPVREGYTDQSGIFDAQNLPVPQKAISENPNSEKAYAAYKIVVTHPRFNTEIFENVPVFEGVESIQDARMELGNSDDEILTVESEPDDLRRGRNAE